MKNHFEIKRRWGCFCKLWPGKTSEFHVRYRFKVIPWRATGESPFEYVDVYKYTQEIRRNVLKLRMERWMMKVLTLLGLKFSSKKMSPAKSTYQVCCIPYSNKFASIWRENVSHINADVKETKCLSLFWKSAECKTKLWCLLDWGTKRLENSLIVRGPFPARTTCRAIVAKF